MGTLDLAALDLDRVVFVHHLDVDLHHADLLVEDPQFPGQGLVVTAALRDVKVVHLRYLSQSSAT